MTGRGWAVDTWRAWCQSEASSQGGAASLHGPADGMVRHLNADTRTLRQPKESVFFALAGPWHDGHAYLQAAHDAGVRRFVVSQPQSEGAPDSSDVLVVPDVLKAMQSMARTQRDAWRERSVCAFVVVSTWTSSRLLPVSLARRSLRTAVPITKLRCQLGIHSTTASRTPWVLRLLGLVDTWCPTRNSLASA